MEKPIAVGTVAASGVAINVPLGWQPDSIKIFNLTDGTRTDEWMAGMAAGTAITTNAAAGPVKTASNGISLFNGDTNTPLGFTIGTAVAITGKTLGYVAMRAS